MQSEQLLKMVINALEDRKAQEIKVLNVQKISNVTDYMVIASGQSNRQVGAIASNVVEESKKHGLRPLGQEGFETGEWVLVDLGDVIVHVMQPDIRDFYQLEKLWSEVGKMPAANTH
jgi:ribosome-associated protein